MGRKLRKGQKGKKAHLVREDKILEHVHIPDILQFRRLCILRGVYPREIPKEHNSPFAAFHKKDLSMLNSDSMAWFIRDHTAWLNKYKKRLHRGEHYGVPEPAAPYAELIRSRYPTFADAVHELDDALTTVGLFAQMSGTKLIASERVAKCRRLMTEFHYYIARSRLLKLGFISFRGFHFEAAVEGEKVLWLIPHSFPIEDDSTVDYRVLLDFLELYEHLVGFVNARLFIQLGMKYPPTYDTAKWAQSFYIDAIVDSFPQPETAPAPAVVAEPASREGLDRMVAALAAPGEQGEDDESVQEDRSLFAGLVFTIHHGVPRDPVSFVIRALGGRVEWNEDSDDPAVTHTVIDRRPQIRHLSRVYVQPQWVFDCLNRRVLLELESPRGSYLPGQELPPHVSPWGAVEAPVEGIADDDDREMVAGGDDSDSEIDQEVQRAAREADYAAGIAAEIGAEERPRETVDKAELKARRREERTRLAAGQLPSVKKKLYDRLREKEQSKGKPKEAEDPQTEEIVLDEEALDNEEEEEEEEEKEE
jgi:pescadillo protein